MENSIILSEISHFAFCKRQWGLLRFNCEWRENTATVEGKNLHEGVDDAFFTENRKGTRVCRALPVFSDTLDINGICDIVVLSNLGVEGTITADTLATVVEFKHGKAKSFDVDFHDGMQLTAQMVCIKEMLGVKCEGYIYYAQTRRRALLSDYCDKVTQLEDLLCQMRSFIAKNEIPLADKKQNCNGCSIANDCMPKTVSTTIVFDEIEKVGSQL